MSYPLMSLAREKGFRVLLTGSGGDEWLTGSYFHYADFLRRFDILSLIRQIRCDREFCRRADTVPAIIFPSLALLRLGLFPLLPPAIQRVVKWAVRRTGVPPWMQRQFAHRARLKERLRNGTSLRRFPTVAQAEIYRAITSGWACQGYELGSRSESRFGLEKRHPLSDRRIVEFALALPEEQRWRGEQPKFILRNAMRGL